MDMDWKSLNFDICMCKDNAGHMHHHFVSFFPVLSEPEKFSNRWEGWFSIRSVVLGRTGRFIMQNPNVFFVFQTLPIQSFKRKHSRNFNHLNLDFQLINAEATGKSKLKIEQNMK